MSTVGFNCGHSSITFLEANPRAHVINFDLPTHMGYGPRARAYVKERYGSRFHIVDGNSRLTIPAHVTTHPNQRCDLVVVDGDHSYASTLLDLVTLLQLAPCNASILIDDVCDVNRCHAHVPPALAHMNPAYKDGSNHPAVVGPTMAWAEAERMGHVALTRAWFGEAADRGWLLGRHVCDASGKRRPVQPRYSVRPEPPMYEPYNWSARVTAAVRADWNAAAKLWGAGGEHSPQSQRALNRSVAG